MAIVLSSFVVRLQVPARSQQILDLHLWQWRQCVGMFCLGAALSRQDWARKVPPAVARRCGIAVIITLVVAPALLLRPASETYFCSEHCAATFDQDPLRYSSLATK